MQVLSLFNGVAGGLSIAHRRLIAHRDIKPANIFLDVRDGRLRPRILDFGLAKTMSRSEHDMDVFGDSQFVPTPFTPAYGAPEQWQRRLGATGAWTDVHALALLCVELLAGKPPLSGSDSAQLMTSCLDPNVRPTPRSLGVDLPDSVEAVFERALSIDPRARHRDARAFWQALCLAAKITDPERQLPRLTLPLFQELGGEPIVRDANDDQATAASMTAAPGVEAAEELSTGLDVPAGWKRGALGTTRALAIAVPALLLCGLFLVILVPAWAAHTPRSHATLPPVERRQLVPPPSSVLVESLVSHAPFAPPPKQATEKRPAQAPVVRGHSSASIAVPGVPPAPTAPRVVPQASANFAETTTPPAPPVESERPASTRGFDQRGAEPSAAAQLDHLMLEDSLTRRK
jgi:serine/threonine-protein kinase